VGLYQGESHLSRVSGHLFTQCWTCQKICLAYAVESSHEAITLNCTVVPKRFCLGLDSVRRRKTSNAFPSWITLLQCLSRDRTRNYSFSWTVHARYIVSKKHGSRRVGTMAFGVDDARFSVPANCQRHCQVLAWRSCAVLLTPQKPVRFPMSQNPTAAPGCLFTSGCRT